MEQLRPVSKLEKILFPIIITIVVSLILPTTAPLVGMLMLGNLFKESGVVRQLTETASNALMYIVVILLGTSVGATTSAEAFLNLDTIKIVVLGLVAFAFGTAAGVLFGKLMCKLSGGKVNPPYILDKSFSIPAPGLTCDPVSIFIPVRIFCCCNIKETAHIISFLISI